MHVAKFCTGYMDNAVFDLTETVDQTIAHLTPHLDEFDTIVGTGFSGGMVIPMLATMLDKKFVLIRKEDDDSHHGPGRLLGELGERWIFVDDFSQSGRTKNRVIEKIQQAARCEYHETVYVGNYYYASYNMSTDAYGEVELLHPEERVAMGQPYPDPRGDELRFLEGFPRPDFERLYSNAALDFKMPPPSFTLEPDEKLVKIGDGFVPFGFTVPSWIDRLKSKMEEVHPLADWEQELLGEITESAEKAAENPIAEVLHFKKSKKPAFSRFTKKDWRKRA